MLQASSQVAACITFGSSVFLDPVYAVSDKIEGASPRVLLFSKGSLAFGGGKFLMWAPPRGRPIFSVFLSLRYELFPLLSANLATSARASGKILHEEKNTACLLQ